MYSNYILVIGTPEEVMTTTRVYIQKGWHPFCAPTHAQGTQWGQALVYPAFSPTLGHGEPQNTEDVLALARKYAVNLEPAELPVYAQRVLRAPETPMRAPEPQLHFLSCAPPGSRGHAAYMLVTATDEPEGRYWWETLQKIISREVGECLK